MVHAKDTTDFIQNAKNVGTLCNQSGDRYPENHIDFEDHRVVDDCSMEETYTNDQNSKSNVLGIQRQQSGDKIPENQIDFKDHRECHRVVDDCPIEETYTNDQNSKSIPSQLLTLGKSEERCWNFKEVANKIVRLQNHCRRFTERDEWKDFTSVNVLFQH